MWLIIVANYLIWGLLTEFVQLNLVDQAPNPSKQDVYRLFKPGAYWPHVRLVS